MPAGAAAGRAGEPNGEPRLERGGRLPARRRTGNDTYDVVLSWLEKQRDPLPEEELPRPIPQSGAAERARAKNREKRAAEGGAGGASRTVSFARRSSSARRFHGADNLGV